MGGKSSTRLVLKKPKTESSIRKVWIPRTLAFILREWKEKQDKLKEFMGDDYIDYNLVLAQETGRPCEDRIIGNQFERLKKSAGLPNVVFHSLRHSSTTYKLKINKGDVKATQGDTGHAQSDMVTQVTHTSWMRIGRSTPRNSKWPFMRTRICVALSKGFAQKAPLLNLTLKFC